MQRYRCFVTCVQTSRFFFLLLSKGLFYIVENGVLLAKENEFPLKTGDKTVGLGLMGKRKTGTSARREKAKLRTALFQRQFFSIYKLQNFYINFFFCCSATESMWSMWSCGWWCFFGMGQNTEERFGGDSTACRSIRESPHSGAFAGHVFTHCCDHRRCRPARSGIKTTECAAKVLALTSQSFKEGEVSHNASQSNIINISVKSAGWESLKLNTERKLLQLIAQSFQSRASFNSLAKIHSKGVYTGS